MSKSGSPPNAVVGEAVIWTLTIWNPHSETIGGVIVNDPVPGMFDIVDVDTPVGTASVSGQVVTVTVPSLNPGQTFDVTITTIANELAEAGEACNTVTSGGASDEACITMYPGMLPETGDQPVGIVWWGIGGAALVGAGAGGYALLRRRRTPAV